MMQKPLKGITVLEFCQYLSGPSAGLRLADLGARVIKIEKPDTGDACRQLAIKNLWVDDSSLLFHTINRNKESFVADLKNPEDLETIKHLIGVADIMIHNFRPGVMDRYDLDYEKVKQLNPSLIYTEITGYGSKGPWKHKPGQDLLAQSLSGLAYATGNQNDGPMPFGLAIGDYLCGNQAVQGILAALIRRRKTGRGALLQLSLMESLIDFQFEFFTTYFQTNKHHKRSEINNGHSLLSAPYGIYHTADGYIAVAMTPIQKLAAVIQCEALGIFSDADAFEKRDAIKKLLTIHFMTASSEIWLQKMHAQDLWAMPVLNWQQLQQTKAYQMLQMEQKITIDGEDEIITLRCPIRINKEKIVSAVSAPSLGEHNIKIIEELLKTQK